MLAVRCNVTSLALAVGKTTESGYRSSGSFDSYSVVIVRFIVLWRVRPTLTDEM